MSEVFGEHQAREAVIRRFPKAVNSGDLDLISQTVEECVAPGALICTPLPIEACGPGVLSEVFARLLRAFPDLRVTIEDLIAGGEKLVGRNTTGTNLGEYEGRQPTSRSGTYKELVVFRFVGARIAETLGLVDVLSQMRQLDVIRATIGWIPLQAGGDVA